MAQIVIEKTKLEGVLVIAPKVFGDARGWFFETWTQRDYAVAGASAVFV
ncbi:MAG: dTDP-4-dehydrorhamnose 3,5-epimerase family protein, partial [Clostridiales Family XIII bacterium]|nr:dTDP-4-dehydrorhamnose 3,5-epimerase family protein [Clostridiales Family XIII bacterium]